ncbi:MAG: hypothetical protein HC897_18950 [Thermoanaerobaculia bacterium]|nr:hypothetical protein [Thermoanaerobaculia bacterium]
MRTAPVTVDQGFVSRLLMGGLSEHEQRTLATRLLASDARFRLELAAVLPPFEIFDLDLMAQYSAALSDHPERAADARARLIERGLERRPDLERMISELAIGDLLELSEPARALFSWCAAELFLARGLPGAGEPRRARIARYLALMVVDSLDILGRAGHSAHHPNVLEDLRRRIFAAC